MGVRLGPNANPVGILRASNGTQIGCQLDGIAIPIGFYLVGFHGGSRMWSHWDSDGIPVGLTWDRVGMPMGLLWEYIGVQVCLQGGSCGIQIGLLFDSDGIASGFQWCGNGTPPRCPAGFSRIPIGFP